MDRKDFKEELLIEFENLQRLVKEAKEILNIRNDEPDYIIAKI